MLRAVTRGLLSILLAFGMLLPFFVATPYYLPPPPPAVTYLSRLYNRVEPLMLYIFGRRRLPAVREPWLPRDAYNRLPPAVCARLRAPAEQER